MPRSVLVPIDDSELSRGALRFAIEEYPRATMTVLNVMEAHDHAGGVRESSRRTETDGGRDENAAWAKERVTDVDRQDVDEGVTEYFEEARAVAAEAGYENDLETAVRSGRPHRAIVDHVEQADHDLVVMGTHGRRGAERAALGSVTERVVRTSPVPVLVYR